MRAYGRRKKREGFVIEQYIILEILSKGGGGGSG
jgi:hypothetical protein